MNFDKQLQNEVTKFTKLCKDRQEQLLASCSREEKKITGEYHSQMEALARKHRKRSEKLQQKLEYRKKALHRKLEHELRIEMKLYRRYLGFRAQSTGRLNTYPLSDNEGSVYSLDTATAARHNALTTSNSSGLGTQPTDNQGEQKGKRGKWTLRKLKKDAPRNQCSLITESDLQSTLKRLKCEMEERLKYSDNEARMAVAQLEWEFLRERHDLKRDYLEAIADFKQRRLSSLSQIKKYQIKGYFDIHRKWLTGEHTHELANRQQASQDALKRVTVAQAIERQTACRLARTTAKGQKQVSHVLYSTKPAKDWLRDRSDKSKENQEASLPARPMSSENTLMELLFPKSNIERAHDDAISQTSRPTYRATSAYSSDGPTTERADLRAQSSQSIPTQYERDGVPVGGSLSQASSKRLIPRAVHSRLLQRNSLYQSKSVQSLHSALEACDNMQRAVMTTLSKQQVDQWTEVLTQERSLTEALMMAHVEQKKSLLQEETAALKRAQTEYENRAAHLAVVLEATEKFTEKEFMDERNGLTEYYYGKQSHLSSHVITSHPRSNETVRELVSPSTSEPPHQQLSPSLPSTLDMYPTGRRLEKTILVTDRNSIGSGASGSVREHVIICRE
ncbi:Centrosomal protein [Paragonimus skrjabini miyazakii]|uniref:Centrosomal protein n=1 Tax=Paragonimus skrjabini miyazakii TaxID=59628 RepID=A0A8S9YEY9_9TREM|nr:Centrosomal protein [Paragonimus skrjabini miyazakii]